jgi:DoxX-like protein
LIRNSPMQTIDQTAPISNGALWTGRVMSGLVIAFLLLDAGMKLIPLDVVLEASAQLGLPAHLARPLGIILLICTLLYALPNTSVLGAILLTGYLGGTVITHLRVGSPLFTHLLFGVYLGLMLWGGLYLRDPRVRALIPLRRESETPH